MVGGVEEHAEAWFAFDPTNHRITITLLNLESNPSGITQVLGSIRFTLTGAGAAPAPTISSFQGNTFGVDSQGNPVINSETPVWKVSNIGGTQIALCTTCSAGGNKDLIIGGPNAAGVYSNANGSIAGNTHNPFIIGSNATYATGVLHGLDTSPSWVITVPTETATVAVSSVTFGFGTGSNYGTNISAPVTTFDDPELPEPGSIFHDDGGTGANPVRCPEIPPPRSRITPSCPWSKYGASAARRGWGTLCRRSRPAAPWRPDPGL